MRHLLTNNNEIIFLDHVASFRLVHHDHNGSFWFRIDAKMIHGDVVSVVQQSFSNKEDRDAACSRSWRLIISKLPKAVMDFNKPITTRKR